MLTKESKIRTFTLPPPQTIPLALDARYRGRDGGDNRGGRGRGSGLDIVGDEVDEHGDAFVVAGVGFGLEE